MPVAVDAVLPLFLIIGFGALVRAGGAVDAAGSAVLSGFAGRIGIPIMIFHTLVVADLSGMSPWWLWACYFPAVAIVWAIGSLLARRVFDHDRRGAVIAGLGASFANTAFIGLPIADRVWGARGAVVVTLLIAVHMPIMLTAATLLMNRAAAPASTARRRPARVVGAIFADLAANPIVVAIAAALIVRVSGLPLPPALGEAVKDMAKATPAVALFALGAGLRFGDLRRDLRPTLTMAALKLVAMPLIVLTAGRLVGLGAGVLGPLVALAGVPAGVNVHLLAVQYGEARELGAGIVVMSTVLGMATETLWLSVL